jgi:hypothetical protein
VAQQQLPVGPAQLQRCESNAGRLPLQTTACCNTLDSIDCCGFTACCLLSAQVTGLPSHLRCVATAVAQAELQQQLSELEQLPRTTEVRQAIAAAKKELRQFRSPGESSWWWW